MNKRFFFVVIVLIFIVCGCKNENEKLEMKLTVAITSYMEKNIDGFKVDSISILGIDSLTDFDFAYFRKVILKNQEEQFYDNPLLYLDATTNEEFDEQERLQKQLQTVQYYIHQCDSILLDKQTDTVSLQYFFVATTIYGKDKQGKNQVHEIGFPVNKTFDIKEISMFD
ncbi:MAG: hypothetical protein LBI60_01820 [Bacteroidales bacterium]|jgi:hypothetical protein|nr:hypothetical protein [Bacteroidales bacterium]